MNFTLLWFEKWAVSGSIVHGFERKLVQENDLYFVTEDLRCE